MVRYHIGAGILAIVSGAVLNVGTAAGQTYTDLVKADSPLLYWNFNEAGATDNAIEQVAGNAADELGAQGTATRVAGTTTTGGVSLGSAMNVSGAGGRFIAADLSPATALQKWAVEFWFQNQDPANPTNDYLFEAFQNSPGLLYNYVGASGPGKLEFFRGGLRTEGATVADAGWHHVVIGYYGSGAGDGVADRQDWYVDGALALSTTRDGNLPFGAGSFAVGNSAFSTGLDPFTGNIDEFAVYDFGLLQDESEISARLAAIAGHYSAVPEPSLAGLACAGLLAAATARHRQRRRQA